MSKLYDLLGSIIFKIKETEGAIPKKVSQLEQDVKVSWNDITGKPDISGGGGGGGVSSWNDLTDRPFGEVEVPAQTITFDGNLEGFEYLTFAESEETSQYYVKLSTTVPAAESFIGSTLSYVMEGEVQTVEVTNDMIRDMGEQGYAVNDVLMVATSDLTAGDKVITAGVWTALVTANGVPFIYTSQITLPGGTVVQKLDEKYLPDGKIMLVHIPRNESVANYTDSQIEFHIGGYDGQIARTAVLVDVGGYQNDRPIVYTNIRMASANIDGVSYGIKFEEIRNGKTWGVYIGENGEVLRESVPLTVEPENFVERETSIVTLVSTSYQVSKPYYNSSGGVSGYFRKVSDDYYEPELFIGGTYWYANAANSISEGDIGRNSDGSWFITRGSSEVVSVSAYYAAIGLGTILTRGTWIQVANGTTAGNMYITKIISGATTSQNKKIATEFLPYNGANLACLYIYEDSNSNCFVSHDASQVAEIVNTGNLPVLFLDSAWNVNNLETYDYLGISDGVAKFSRQEGLDLKYIEIDESGMVTRTTDTSAKDALKAEIVAGLTNALPTAEGGSF